MHLRDIDFGAVWNSSGARGFFGEGPTTREYFYHKPYSALFGLDYFGSTFVAKTTTTDARPGHMPLDARYRPRELRPRCMVVKFRAGVVLNAVGLSGPGIRALLTTGKWQVRTAPFILSFMATGETQDDRLRDTWRFVDTLRPILPSFAAPVALQVNFSCPNVGHPLHTVLEIRRVITALDGLDVPLVAKFNVLEPISNVMEIADHPALDAVACSNTIPWGQRPDVIPWAKLFGSDTSPLARRGLPAGGLSGRPLLPPAFEWINRLRCAGFSKPVVGGGGILSLEDAGYLRSAGADAVELGVVSILRPWRVPGIIRGVA